MKKFLSLALALIMVLSLVACGDTASDNTDNSNTDANTEQTGEIKGLTAEERAKEFITVGTGPTSGIYHRRRICHRPQGVRLPDLR